MLGMGFMLVLAYANSLNVPAWAWVLFGVQAFIEVVSVALKAMEK